MRLEPSSQPHLQSLRLGVGSSRQHHSPSVVVEEAGEAAAAILQGEGLSVDRLSGGLAGVKVVVAGSSGREDLGNRAGLPGSQACGASHLSPGLCSHPGTSASHATHQEVAS